MTAPAPQKRWLVDKLPVELYASNDELGQAAANKAQQILKKAINQKGFANLILATGNSQLTFLKALRILEGIEWQKVRIFHMDEYIGIDPSHPASFPLFLENHFLQFTKPGHFHPIPSVPSDVSSACKTYEALIRQHPADLVAMGWGENGHIAFNDPPDAHFDDPHWVKVVDLAEESRLQQVGEGHFTSLNKVPKQAITLTIPALMSPVHILCIVPETRKANAVKACLSEPVEESRPGSILRTISHATLLLDQDSASLL
ncbi:MAG: glucosamine-6-phosphate deaminase [SAR324 cluster bacterium]|uniref:Glucosamine-6-phosphate deaminase n=1 Tax=SAR324 cluster bacterium TaxID=2024889 RepID=A0A2D6YM18_9DELT|nr:glucosamine-6-phosphate deaminase [SAR324 cluster bacterium]